MVKNRGCSCWPFLRTAKSSANSNLKSQGGNQSTPNNNRGIQRQSLTNMNNNFQNANIMVIQRSQVNYNNGNLQHLDTTNSNMNNQQQQIQNRSRTTEVNQRGSLHEQQQQQAINIQSVQNAYGLDVAQQQFINIEEVRNRNKVRIKTNVQKQQVQYRDEYPLQTEEQQVYKYCCPICLRYFNNILVSSCCMNYLCRLCIGEMAKKAKKDLNFIIKCPHCFENEFKLNDVKHEDKVKFYTDTPFKFAKNAGKESGNKTNETNDSSIKKQDDNMSPGNPYSPNLLDQMTPNQQLNQMNLTIINNNNQIVSPSFQIHLTDISYSQQNRHSDLYNPLMMNRNEQHFGLPNGDEDNQPLYESPYHANFNSQILEHENEQILSNPPSPPQIHKSFVDQEDEEERKSQQLQSYREIYIQQEEKNSALKMNKDLSVQSIPLFKNDSCSLMDQVIQNNSVQNLSLNQQESQSDRFFQNNSRTHHLQLNQDDNSHIRRSLQSLNIRESLLRIQSAHNSQSNNFRQNSQSSFKPQSQISQNFDEKNLSKTSQQLLRNLENVNLSNQEIQSYLNQDLCIKTQRKISSSNHSNKSEEVKSTMKKQINELINPIIQHDVEKENIGANMDFEYDNYGRIHNSMSKRRLPNHVRLSGIIPVRELLAQKLTNSDVKVNRKFSIRTIINCQNNEKEEQQKDAQIGGDTKSTQHKKFINQRHSMIIKTRIQQLSPEKRFILDTENANKLRIRENQ